MSERNVASLSSSSAEICESRYSVRIAMRGLWSVSGVENASKKALKDWIPIED